MAKLLYQLEGVRGRSAEIYDRKCVIATKPTVGSFITGNVTDGEKTIFYADVIGIQFKKSGGLIGYLQFETASAQMNNQNSNMFSESTFTFENGKNGITNEMMEAIYHQVCGLVEAVKYGDPSVADFEPIQFQTAPAYAEPASFNRGYAETTPYNGGYAEPAPAPMAAPQPRFCSGCGKPAAADDKFCMGCGQKLY